MTLGYCERCYNTGELDCYCGGDFCICERNGTYDCPNCSRENGFACDEIEDGFDAGEWNNVPEQKVVDVGDDLHQVLADALKKWAP